MSIKQILLAFYTGFLVFSLLTFFLGKEGVRSMTVLKRYEHEALVNLNQLKNLNRQLNAELQSLKTSPDLITLKARGLGYFRADDKVLFIKGLETPDRPVHTGRVIYYSSRFTNRDRIFRAIAFIVCVFSLFVMIIGNKLKKGVNGN